VIDIEVRCDDTAIDTNGLVSVIRSVCERLGIDRASVGLMIVGPDAMAEINGEHRATPTPTDVLAFPIDGPDVRAGWPDAGPAAELGDIVICPDAAQEPLSTLAVHGLLHLVGYDHETDAGEMLALQDVLVGELVS
jgi:probable rRNA maturation factor